jgi:hypothetical protein
MNACMAWRGIMDCRESSSLSGRFRPRSRIRYAYSHLITIYAALWRREAIQYSTYLLHEHRKESAGTCLPPHIQPPSLRPSPSPIRFDDLSLGPPRPASPRRPPKFAITDRDSRMTGCSWEECLAPGRHVAGRQKFRGKWWRRCGMR